MTSRRSYPSDAEKRKKKKTSEEKRAKAKGKLFAGDVPPPSLFICPDSQLASGG